MADNNTKNPLLRRMKSRGLRVTLPRRVIIDELGNAGDYVSAEEVYMKIHEDHPGIGLATVYRTLTLLTQMGIVTKFEFGDGKARYELAELDNESKHHHVLVCEQCYNVIKYAEFSEDEKQSFDKLEKMLEKTFDFDIHKHVVHYYGLCASCRSSEA